MLLSVVYFLTWLKSDLDVYDVDDASRLAEPLIGAAYHHIPHTP
jgi:hypothetical protein